MVYGNADLYPAAIIKAMVWNCRDESHFKVFPLSPNLSVFLIHKFSVSEIKCPYLIIFIGIWLSMMVPY